MIILNQIEITGYQFQADQSLRRLSYEVQHYWQKSESER